MGYQFVVVQKEIAETLPSLTTPSGKDLLPFKFRLYTMLARRRWMYAHPDTDSIYEEPNLITEGLMLVELADIKLLSRRDMYAGLMVKYLSGMGVPELAQPPIIEEIFKVADVAVPKLPILVAIGDITYVDSGGLFPATKSAIRGLEKVRLDSLDEATVTRTSSCVICLKDLDHQHMVTRLPCSHVYHADCIVSWLKTSHYCPVCRYSMPFVEECQLSILSGGNGANPSISISEGSSSGQGANPSISISEGSRSGQGANSLIFEGSGTGQGANHSISEGIRSGQGENPSKSEGSGSSRRWTPPLLMVSAGGIIIGIVTITLICRLWKRT